MTFRILFSLVPGIEADFISFIDSLTGQYRHQLQRFLDLGNRGNRRDDFGLALL
jgi:hypothetical protein